MSPLTGQGNSVWSGLYLAFSVVGIFIFSGLMQAFYVTPYHVTCWWIKGLLLLVCIIAGVGIFGGIVILFWHIWENRVLINHEVDISHNENQPKSKEIQPQMELPDQSSYAKTNYGHRPDFQCKKPVLFWIHSLQTTVA